MNSVILWKYIGNVIGLLWIISETDNGRGWGFWMFKMNKMRMRGKRNLMEFGEHDRKQKEEKVVKKILWTHTRLLIRPRNFCSNFCRGSSPYAARYHSSSCRRSFHAAINSLDSARSSASCSAVSKVTGFCCPKAL